MGEEKHALRTGQSARWTATVLPGEALTAPVTILAPGTPFGERYEIRGLLGSGGFAVVYRAFDRELKREVALKVLRAERMSDAVLERFRREAAVTRDAASPRLLRTFDIGSAAGAIFLSMEAVDGPSLRDRLEDGPLPVAEALRVTVEILEGLSVLHSLGIVHRDVKPGNVLLAEDGVKLADFGLAFRFEEPETRVTVAGAALGTLEYMAPEQVLGHEVDARADLYSLGLVFFEMLSGEMPCKRKSSLGTLLAHLDSSIPDVRQLRPDAPRWISRILARLLEKKPANRYQSAESVLADLRAGRFPFFRTRRFRRAAALAVLVMGLTVIGLGLIGRARPESGIAGDPLRFSHLNRLGESGVAAIGIGGETLWTLPDVDWEAGLYSTLAHLSPSGPPSLAMVLRRRFEFTPDVVRTLSFLDAESGEIVKQVRLPSAAGSFPSFSDRYRPDVVRAEDLDRDGIDEIVVTYEHIPEWPFYTVLYEPRFERSRIVFVASGHHRALGIEDLDGDGRAELIFAGINNSLGWYNAAAAVRLVPWIGEGLDEVPHNAFSPDDPRSRWGVLLWYSLLPRGAFPADGLPVIADSAERTLWFPYSGGQRQQLSYDGFPPLPASPKPPATRKAHRQQAYARMQEALRLLRANFAAEAIAESEAAVSHAEKAEEPFLMECMRRLHGKVLIGTFHSDAAEALFEGLARESSNASEIAFDAGQSFHLQGDLERAVRWYRRGTGPGGTENAGKGKFRLLEGTVLALVELGRWRDAHQEIARFDATYHQIDIVAVFREYVRWRAGEMPRIPALTSLPRRTDSQRYWLLEFRNARGEKPAELLSAVESLMGDVYEVRAQLLSLQAELLAKVGQEAAALDLAREAFDLIAVEQGANTLARAHLDLVAARLAKVARANNSEVEAARTEQMAREMLARTGKGG